MIVINDKPVTGIIIGGKEVKTIANTTGYIFAKPASAPATFTGVKIMDLHGNVYSSGDWTKTAAEAIGVAVGDGTSTTGHRIVLTKKFLQHSSAYPCQFTVSNTVLIPGMTTTTVYNTAITDFAGKANSTAVLTALAGGTLASANVCTWCNRFYSPWGENAYCPASGQMKMLYDNAAAINICMALIDGDTFVTTSAEYYWCSTQYNANIVWGKGGNMNVQLNKAASGNTYKALAVFDY